MSSKIDTMYTFIMTMSDGQELIPTMTTPTGIFVPCIANNLDMMKLIAPKVQHLCEQCGGLSFRLYKFSGREDVTEELK